MTVVATGVAAAVLVQVDRDAAQAGVVGREAVAGDVVVLGAADRDVLEVVEVVARLEFDAAGGADRVTTHCRRSASSRPALLLARSRCPGQIREAVGAVGAVTVVATGVAAAVLVQVDRHATQARIVGREAVAGDVGVLGAGDRDVLEVVEVVAGGVGAAGGADRVAGIAAGLRLAGRNDSCTK